MAPWPFKQLFQIIVSYVIALLVGAVFVSLAHFFIISSISNSFFAKIMILPLFSLMIYSVVVWHLVAQFLSNMVPNKWHDETQSVIITVVLAIAGIVIWLPELAPLATKDITLFVSTFTIAAGLCGFMMDWLKTKEWALCHYISN
jgi:hypothetical protein